MFSPFEKTARKIGEKIRWLSWLSWPLSNFRRVFAIQTVPKMCLHSTFVALMSAVKKKLECLGNTSDQGTQTLLWNRCWPKLSTSLYFEPAWDLCVLQKCFSFSLARSGTSYQIFLHSLNLSVVQKISTGWIFSVLLVLLLCSKVFLILNFSSNFDPFLSISIKSRLCQNLLTTTNRSVSSCLFPQISIRLCFFSRNKLFVILRKQNWKESIQFSSRPFFVFLEVPMARRVHLCIVVGVVSITCVRCHLGWEAGGGGFELHCRQKILRFLDTRYHVLIF